MAGLITQPTVAESHLLSYHSGSTELTLLALPETEPDVVGWNLNAVSTTTQQNIEEEKPLTYDNDSRLLCNCYAYVREVHPELPHTSVIRNNITDEGNVAVFFYPSSGVYHYAVVVDRTAGKITIDETNFKRCQFSRREISTNYPYLLGFFSTG